MSPYRERGIVKGSLKKIIFLLPINISGCNLTNVMKFGKVVCNSMIFFIENV